MPHAAAADIDARDMVGAASRWWNGALYVLLVLTFVTGGSSQEHGWTDAVAQLLSLPVLGIALLRLSLLPPSRVRALGIAAVGAIALLPWVQLLPLPQGAWNLAPARVALATDISIAGVSAPTHTWSLAPAASLRAGLLLLPAVALFVGVLSVDTRTQRRLLILCVVLPLASLLLGFLQLGAPQDSLLNPYPQWAPAMNGLFANPNHQGTAMLVGLGVCLSFAIGVFEATDAETANSRNPWPALIAGAFLLLGLPLTNSRAAVVIGVLIIVVAPLVMAGAAVRGAGVRRVSGTLAVMTIAIAAIGIHAAVNWMRVDEIEEIRSLMREATAMLATTHLPWGSGVGSFVPVFGQAVPSELLMPKYINAAHNDFVQVWLESGFVGATIAVFASAALLAALRLHWRRRINDRRIAWAVVLALSSVLTHSFADYPLRTPALLAVALLLAGIMFAQLNSESPPYEPTRNPS